MKQAYGKTFAQVYNKRWTGFAISMAPRIEALLQSKAESDSLPKTLLDICCGTGQLAQYFLGKGYTVHGIDLSPYMLEIARSNNEANVSSGTGSFSVQDASHFQIRNAFSYATCLFDSMNHLDSMGSVRSCFQHTYDILTPKGWFIFDINTKKGLRRWNSVSVQEDDEVFILNRGLFEDEMDRAYTQITGFLRVGDGRYERFSETAYNLVLSVDHVVAALKEAGFRSAYCANAENLAAPVADPEALGRAYIISQKP
jgi:SAM-dependent methyltransferase